MNTRQLAINILITETFIDKVCCFTYFTMSDNSLIYKQKANSAVSKITPTSRRMANVMKITYSTMSTKPMLFRSLNFAINKHIQRHQVAMIREPTTIVMPLESINTALSSSPRATIARVLISHGKPRANNMAKELAPSALDTPTPPSPVIKIHLCHCPHTQ